MYLPRLRLTRAEKNDEAFSVSERCARKPDMMSAGGADEIEINIVEKLVLIDEAFDGCARLRLCHSGKRVDGQHHHLILREEVSVEQHKVRGSQ